jgi:hypothetical protein
MEIYIFNYNMFQAISNNIQDPIESLFEFGSHKGSVFDLSVCPTKAVLASICEDKSAKLWEMNSKGEFKCIMSSNFHENPLSISIHPLAFQCAIGFKEGYALKF